MSSVSITTLFDSKANESFIRFVVKNIREIKVYRFALYNFVLSNLRMRYRRSALGFLWSLLNPLMVMTVMSVVFSLLFQQDIKVFSIYIFSGLAPWTFINTAIQQGATSLVNAEGFLKKVYLPKMVFPLITTSTETINFLFSLSSLYLLALLLGSEITWRLLLLPLALLITFIFVLGMSILLAVITVYFRDLTQIVSVVFTALFYTVPIVYPLHLISPEIQKYFLLNPFYYFINLYRKIIYGHQEIVVIEWFIPLAIALAIYAIAMFALMKKDKDIIYRL
jgi:ABC-type polysaccharide/polyol phosphate export permease